MPRTEPATARPSPPAPAKLAAGAAWSLHAADVLASAAARERFASQAFAVLVDGQPLAVTLHGCGDGDAAVAALGELYELLAAAAAGAGADPGRIDVAIPASALPPVQAWRLRRTSLGPGTLYLLGDAGLLQPGASRHRSRAYGCFWQQLWQQRSNPGLRLATASAVSSACVLLPGEHADSLQPATALQVPAGSAWVSLAVDLLDFADARGRIDRSALAARLRQATAAADTLHDRCDWPTPAMRNDAWMNRRLAIMLEGIGDIVRRRGDDPRQLACLQRLEQLLAWCRAVVYEQSRRLARRDGYLPALQLDDAFAQSGHGNTMHDWCRHWQRAVEVSALRHRNLLALSPWSVFPRTANACSDYLDLLPLLAAADAVSFPEPPALLDWNINKFMNLHQRTWAILERRNARQRIARTV